MVRCRLSRLMGDKKVKVIDVARETGISRNHLSALYYERAKRIDLNTIDALCKFFDCNVGDLLEVTNEESLNEDQL